MKTILIFAYRAETFNNKNDNIRREKTKQGLNDINNLKKAELP
jgi:hypothetical protein